MRWLIFLLSGLIGGSVLGASPTAGGVAMLPEEVLTLLKAGNARFVSGNSLHPRQHALRRKHVAAHGQTPVATILTCSDSRVPPEILFDQGLGDLFVVRVVGNVVNADEAGSIEYGVAHLQTPLLVILGHTGCGAVSAVVEGTRLEGNIPGLVKNIVPAVEETRKRFPELEGSALVPYAVQANVQRSVLDLVEKSSVVSARIRSGELTVVGGIYDLASGRIQWTAPNPQLAGLAPRPKPKPKPPVELPPSYGRGDAAQAQATSPLIDAPQIEPLISLDDDAHAQGSHAAPQQVDSGHGHDHDAHDHGHHDAHDH